MYKRTINNTLSFTGEPLMRGRHKIHPYPAMLHPLLIKYLLEKYAHADDVILDPFCGSGVTLLESSLKNHRSIGCDLNPLALLIASVKNVNYNIDNLLLDFKKFRKDISSAKDADKDTPGITNIEYWYQRDVIDDLSKIRYVLKHRKYTYRDFFVVCFAFVCRNQSLTRNGEFKRYKMSEDQVQKFQGDVINKLFSHIESMIEIIRETEKPKKKPLILLQNSEHQINGKLKYDLVITSPPYGDSGTTVAYGQYSSFGMDWVSDLIYFGRIKYNIDNECVGKKDAIDENIFDNGFLNDIIKKIRAIDVKRSNDVLYFYNGYYKVLKNVVNFLSENGKAVFIVGNRTVKGYQIPMDQITAYFLERLGLKFDSIFVRGISNKVMPARNSPTNEAGKTKNTMRHEYIVAFNK